MTQAHELSAAQLHSAYRAGSLSPVEVTRSLIAHVQRWEPHIAAAWAFEPDVALAMARSAELRWQRGQPLGALDGVPVTVKENIATRGHAMPTGTAAALLQPLPEDAPPAARLREAGAVFLSKTTMPDYGMLSSGVSSFHGITRNPWHLGMAPGGSSSGAGAAAAAGYGPLHLGTDIGGSIRLPAGWCGVVGFKPSNGRVPIKPPYIGRVAGPLTRTVTDAALMMATLSLPDPRDATSLPAQALPWLELGTDPAQTLRGLKIGLWLDAGWGLALDDDILRAVQAAARLLAAAGATVEPLAPFATREMADGINRFWRLRSWLDISALPAPQRDKVLPFIRQWVAEAEGYSAAQAFAGYSQIGLLRDATTAACQRHDFVISPVAPVSAFPAEWGMPTNDPLRAMEHIAYTLPFNMSEQPALSVPCSFTAAGLPIGLQIAGQRHDDVGVLRVARAFEQLRPPLRAWPLPPA
jgi:Asp-tRNA(Asn)/Glu-tRNA(Gln) amidotransferase A subunit family amidase